MSIDFQSCFDRIEHQAIYGALKYFGFGDTYVSWVKLFFSKFTLYTQNFGMISEGFDKTRGANQGCNISPFCYLLCGEILARKLKQNSSIKGIEMENGVTHLLSQFADDTALYLSYDKITLESTITTLATIEANTGLRVNYDKTLIYRIGSLAGSDAKIYTTKEFKWTNHPFTLLGLTISNDEAQAGNYESLVDKICEVTNVWSKRLLTLMGRVLIVNTLCESLFVYKMSVTTDMPKPLADKITDVIDRFIWKGKRARVARSTLQQSRNTGGLRLFDVKAKQKALKIAWIPKIMSSDCYKVSFFRNVQIPDVPFIFECSVTKKDSLKFCNKNEFWGQCYTHWCEYSWYEPDSTEEVLKQIIWHNSSIKVGGTMLMNHKCVEAGVIRLEDIHDENRGNGCIDYNEFVVRYGKCVTWLEYASLCNAIPFFWKCFMRSTVEKTTDRVGKYEKIENGSKIANIVFKDIISSENIVEKYRIRWGNAGVEISSEEYEQSFRNLYKITSFTKYRDFQYRLLLNKIPTNIDLHIWGYKNTDLCTFCNIVSESISHMFMECKYIQPLWKWLDEIIVIDNLTIKKLVTNQLEKPKSVVNFIVLVTKQYIYRLRCQGMRPTVNGLQNEIKLMYNIEQIEAIQNVRLSKFKKRWSPVNIDQDINNI